MDTTQTMALTTDFQQTGFGRWATDEAGLPCFDADLENRPVPYHPFFHLLGTGHVGVLVNQWGNVNLLTTEGGTIALTPSTGRTRSGLYVMLAADGELVSLLYSELTHNKKFRYGLGYAEYSGEIRTSRFHVSLHQEFLTPPDKRRGFIGHFTLTNLSARPLAAQVKIRSDIYPRPLFQYSELQHRLNLQTGSGWASFKALDETLGDVYLIGQDEWLSGAQATSLFLSREVLLEPGVSLSFSSYLGYGREYTVGEIQDYLKRQIPMEVRRQWARKLSGLNVNAPEEWMLEECRWCLGQLLGFSHYDASVDEYYVNLGGYCYFSNPDEPFWNGFPVREDCETALVLAYWEPELAKSSLRWVGKTQLANGDIPKGHSHRRERGPSEFESDNEIWFILGGCEYVKTTGDMRFFDEPLPYWDSGQGPVWEHLQRAFVWIRDQVGTGAHGLVLIREGDWNDYLSKVGEAGKGESVMNTGMACRAFSALAHYARARGETDFAVDLERWASALRAAVAETFDQAWFIRAYTDAGAPVGAYAEDRLFLNAQSWAALGGCGTPDQRRKALLSAVEKCHTAIGLTLMSRPYSSPAPEDISWAPLPAGEGENAGVWPQTVYWIVWALAEEGLIDEALAEWKCMSLRNHARLYPDVPFGIFSGPDCYSSKYAGAFEGWTQRQIFNRMVGTPMNPIIAWQAFAMQKINEAQRRKADLKQDVVRRISP